jgi:hypothetical protein
MKFPSSRLKEHVEFIFIYLFNLSWILSFSLLRRVRENIEECQKIFFFSLVRINSDCCPNVTQTLVVVKSLVVARGCFRRESTTLLSSDFG